MPPERKLDTVGSRMNHLGQHAAFLSVIGLPLRKGRQHIQGLSGPLVAETSTSFDLTHAYILYA